MAIGLKETQKKVRQSRLNKIETDGGAGHRRCQLVAIIFNTALKVLRQFHAASPLAVLLRVHMCTSYFSPGLHRPDNEDHYITISGKTVAYCIGSPISPSSAHALNTLN